MSAAQGSQLEQTIAFQFKAVGLPPPEREYRFHPDRKWRFDFAFPDQLVAVEVEGGIFGRNGGGHRSASGFLRDLEKYNAAAELGWRVLRFTDKPIIDGSAVQQVMRVIFDPRAERAGLSVQNG